MCSRTAYVAGVPWYVSDLRRREAHNLLQLATFRRLPAGRKEIHHERSTMVGQVVSSEDASGYLMKDIRGKDEILDLLTLLLRTESIIYPVHKDYISHIRCIAERSNVAGDIVNDSWRRKLCEWSYEVTDHFKCKKRFCYC